MRTHPRNAPPLRRTAAPAGAGDASAPPLPDNAPAMRAGLRLLMPAPSAVDHSPVQPSTAPALTVRAPGTISPEGYAQLPTHAQAAVINRRWLAWQSAPIAHEATCREADKLIDALLELHAVRPIQVDRHAMMRASLCGTDIGFAVRLSALLVPDELPLNADEIAGCAAVGLEGLRGAQILRLYRAMQVPLRADTAPCVWKKDAYATMQFLREGSYNATSTLSLDGKQHVFKPDPGLVSPAHVKGPAFAPRMNCSVNNFAASALDAALGWKTICKVRLAVGEHKGALRLGIVMDFVQGKSLTTGAWRNVHADGREQLREGLDQIGPSGSPQRKRAWIYRLITDKMVGVAEDDDTLMILPDRSTGDMPHAVACRPDIIVGMLRKQAVDWIIGDLDSSSGNYLYDAVNAAITGFDKDFTFATRAAFEENYCWEGDVPAFWRNMGVPPLLDHASYADVRRLRDRLPALLEGLLAPEAIRACMARTNLLLCFTRTASIDELAAMDWRKPPSAGSLNGSTLLWRDVYRFG